MCRGLLTSRQAYALMPQTFEDCVELLIPELQRRGLFWEDYFAPGATYRENLYEVRGQSDPPDDHPAGKMVWKVEDDIKSRPNGIDAVNGHIDDGGVEALDPTSMQLG